MIDAAVKAAADKKAGDTVVLDVAEVLGITEYFVITSGSNDRQVKTIAEEIERRVGDTAGERPLHIEGLDTLRWVLLDYGDIVVHVFHQQAREFYDLERLWADVPRRAWSAAEG